MLIEYPLMEAINKATLGKIKTENIKFLKELNG